MDVRRDTPPSPSPPNHNPMKSLILIYSLILGILPKEVPYRTLCWDDFRGPITKSVAAEIVTELELTWEETNGKYTFSVSAYFLPDSSFTTTDRQEILDHENLHFSIAVLKAHQCNQALSKCNNLKEAYKIYNHYVDSLEKLQELYDMESAHSINAIVQKKWEENIKNDLNKLTWNQK